MKKTVAGLLALLMLSGCAPHARELDGLALVRVLGVDGGGGVRLTAVCGGEEGGEAARGSVGAEDFTAARRALPWVGEREMALTNLSYIIIGMGADLTEALSCVLADHEMSPAATVWLAADAGALLALADDPAGRLAVLEEQGIVPPTAVEVLAGLTAAGTAELPLLVWSGERLEAAGTLRWEESG